MTGQDIGGMSLSWRLRLAWRLFRGRAWPTHSYGEMSALGFVWINDSLMRGHWEPR